jgi:hypothetical protein
MPWLREEQMSERRKIATLPTADGDGIRFASVRKVPISVALRVSISSMRNSILEYEPREAGRLEWRSWRPVALAIGAMLFVVFLLVMVAGWITFYANTGLSR